MRAAPSIGAAPDTGTRLPRLQVADGTLEALKWLGLVLMVLDHTNKFVFKQGLPGVFELARIVMPLFAFVLAYNLARPATDTGAVLRTLRRLLLFGLLASPMFVAMVGWWPLNILFTLALTVALIGLLRKGGALQLTAAALLFLAGGAVVEYWWPAVLCGVMAWFYCRKPTAPRLAGWILAVAALGFINGNLWALVSFPLIFTASAVPLQVPRLKYLFYAAYPLHLVATWLVL